MRIVNHQKFYLELPEGHRFPMMKYDLLPKQLLLEGIASKNDFFEAREAKLEELELVHPQTYVSKLTNNLLSKQEARAIGFPLTQELIERELLIVGGTIDCVDEALKTGCAFTIAGGTHHAYQSHGEGFCVFNDIAVAAFNSITNMKAKSILVVDLDVHQGNGTAKICENRADIFTFSIHGAKNYPHHKEKSDLDIALEDHADDDQYLNTLKSTLPKLIANIKPDLIFYQAGVDVLESDKLGRMNLSIEGCYARDVFVFEQVKKNGIAIVTTMGGGYSQDIRKIVQAHTNTFRAAQSYFS